MRVYLFSLSVAISMLIAFEPMSFSEVIHHPDKSMSPHDMSVVDLEKIFQTAPKKEISSQSQGSTAQMPNQMPPNRIPGLIPVESIAVMGDVGHTQLVIRLPQKTFYEISTDSTHQQLTLSLDNIDPASSILPVDLNNTAIQNIQYNITQENQLQMVLTLAPTVNVQGLRMIDNGSVELLLDLGIGNIPYIKPKLKQTPGPYVPLMKTPDPLSPEELAQKDYIEAVNLLTQNNTESAVLLLQTILQQHPEFEQARVTLAEVYLNQDQPQKSLSILKAVNISDVSAHTDYYTALAEAYRQTGSLQTAADLYQSLLNTDANNATWWAGLGMCLQALNQSKSARAAFVKADSLGSLSLPLQQYVSKQLTQDS